MKLTIKNVKVSGPNRRWVLDQFQKYADRFDDRKFTEVEMTRILRDVHIITVYNTQGMLAGHKPFESRDLMIGYILGANAHMTRQHIIKELE